MNIDFKKIYNTILDSDTSPKAESIDELYRYSFASLIILAIIAAAAAFFLYPYLNKNIYIWAFLLEITIAYRLFDGYRYIKHPDYYSSYVWYKKFSSAAMLTAMTLSSLSIFLFELDDFYQLFIVALLLGVSSGSSLSLSSDFRMRLIYTTILMLPLVLILGIIGNDGLGYGFVISLLIYYALQMMLSVKSFFFEQKYKDANLKRSFLRNLFKESPVAIISYDTNLRVTDCNPYLLKLFNLDKETIIGMDLTQLRDKRVLPTFIGSLYGGSQKYEGPYISLLGKEYWLEIVSFPFEDNESITLGGVAILNDKTKEREAIQEMEYMAGHDMLTGLLNRRGLKQQMYELVSKKEHQDHFSLLFYIDLNNFKGINDSMGHSMGDKVLVAVARRVTNRLDDSCIIGRVGGDEFVVVVPHIAKSQIKSESFAAKRSDMLNAIFTDPFSIDEHILHIQASIGIVIIEPKYSDVEEMIRFADITMYHAKKERLGVSYYSASMDKRQKELFELQNDLSKAILDNEFEIYMQPIVDLGSNNIKAAEVLLRWEHPDHGLLLPERFISLVLESGLLNKITWWVVDEVFSNISRFKQEGIWSLEYISFNVNARSFMQKEFAATLIGKLKKYSIAADEIMIEITEESLVKNFDQASRTISKLRENGIRCAIDDFGTDYSSLLYLKKLPFFTIKIDREFIADIATQKKDLNLLSGILSLANKLGYEMIIEGVEDEEQMLILKEFPYKLSYQGFLFDHPQNIEMFKSRHLNKTVDR